MVSKKVVSSAILLLLMIAVVSAVVLIYILANVHVGVSPANVSVETVNIDLTGLKSGEVFYRTADVHMTVENVYNPYIVIYSDDLTHKDIYKSLNLTIQVDNGTPGTIDLLMDGQFAQSITEGSHILHLNLSGELGLVPEQIDDTFHIKMRLETGKK